MIEAGLPALQVLDERPDPAAHDGLDDQVDAATQALARLVQNQQMGDFA